MINMRNFGIVEGRLVREPQTFENKDGSRKVKFTIAAQDNFRSKGDDGKMAKNSQFIQLEAFINKDRTGETVYDLIHKGDMVGVQFSVRSNNYTDASGNTVYSQILVAESVDLKETKATVNARKANAAAPAAAEEPIDDQPFAE